ncbi:MAG TPA: hypothetical protein VGM91_08095 [Conexibacter sp.]|jgi:hypothetical protein
MTTRRVVLVVSLAFVALLVFITFADAVNHGITIRAVVSLPIIVLLGVGVIGGLAQPPRR